MTKLKYENIRMPWAAATVDVAPMSRLFRALGDEVRLRIVALLAHGELCVCHIEEALGLTQTNASRQLGLLRAAGVVSARRQERWVHYRLARQADRECERYLRLVVASFAKQELLRKDSERLLASKGPGKCK
jgi:ArsR family transcriptional regulator